MGAADVAALLMRHRGELHAYLLAATRNPHDAEDLLQEVAMVAASSADAFVPGTNFPAWIREIARRRVLELGRTRRRASLMDPDLLQRLDLAAAEEPIDPRRDALRECLDGLAPHAREVVELRYVDRLAVDSIAAKIGRTVQAAYAILKRSRIALKECADRKLKGALS